ncbi:hypothetical protein LCGC14_1850960 [marine sediment metagenome]|uniref:Uncharacterized protein n=1 Tax=marine sediment metagenome TaxID=412755 RepID=A0A0F9GYQ5_9ZZZZ
MIDEHSREDELIVQIIGLKGKIEKLQEEKKKIIEEFQIQIKYWRKMIHFYRDKGYPDEWKDNITKIRDDMNKELKKWEERKKK